MGNPIITGLVTAMQLKHAMDQASLQREELARRKSRDKREDDLSNFQSTMALMNSGAKPVDQSGTYQSSAIQQPGLPNFANMQAPVPSVPMQTQAPVDQNRVVKAPGTGQQFYIPTQDEQFAEGFQRELQKMHAASDIKTQEKMAELSTQFNFQAGIHGMDNASHEGIAKLNVEAANTRAANSDKNRKIIADEANKTREKLAKERESGLTNRTAYVQSEENARQAVSEEGKNKRAKTGITETSRLSKIESLKRERLALQQEQEKMHAGKLESGQMQVDGPSAWEYVRGQKSDGEKARDGIIAGKQNRINEIGTRISQIDNSLKLLDRGGVANPYK